jgi:hypothetical protein
VSVRFETLAEARKMRVAVAKAGCPRAARTVRSTLSLTRELLASPANR